MYNPTFSSTFRSTRFGRGGGIARSTNGALTDDVMRQFAPSIFAEEAHGSRSEKFTYIPTIEVLNGLRKEGFQPYEVRQGGSKDAEKRGFTKHMIRLRQEGAQQVGDSFRELILLNAHDGTSSYQLINGVFRLVCSNGLIVSEGEALSMRVPHKGDIVGDVIEGAFRVIDDGKAIDGQMDEMRALTLHKDEQEAFALAAAELRFDEGKNPLRADQINRSARQADQGSDLWRTFNRVQESLVRGGDRYNQTDARGFITARRTTRPVNSVDENVRLNRALWRLASEMGKIKTAEPVAA